MEDIVETAPRCNTCGQYHFVQGGLQEGTCIHCGHPHHRCGQNGAPHGHCHSGVANPQPMDECPCPFPYGVSAFSSDVTPSE